MFRRQALQDQHGTTAAGREPQHRPAEKNASIDDIVDDLTCPT
jgi:hypothetical protein